MHTSSSAAIFLHVKLNVNFIVKSLNADRVTSNGPLSLSAQMFRLTRLTSKPATALRPLGASIARPVVMNAVSAVSVNAPSLFDAPVGGTRAIHHTMWSRFKMTHKMKWDRTRRETVQKYELERRLYKSMVCHISQCRVSPFCVAGFVSSRTDSDRI